MSYTEYGIGALDQFNGMFAFAISDVQDGSVLLVRDQLGIKPLYYYHAPDGTLVFSSELGALVANPVVPRQLDHESLSMLLVDRFIDDPFTLFKDVYQLPPGHWLRWTDGKTDIQQYYQFEPQPHPHDESEAIEELRARLDETVASQLVADVPVAAFLSGGIDSSTVTAFAARHLGADLHTFSVGFSHSAYDESGVARAVAKHVKSTHHELRVEDSTFDPELMERIVRHVGQPLGDASCIPTLMLSEYARKHVKVVLSGDGGDEFYGGYTYVMWAGRIAQMRDRIPHPWRRLIQALLNPLSRVAPGRAAVVTRRARKALALTFLESREMMRCMMAQWQPSDLSSLLADPPPGPLRVAGGQPLVDPDTVSPVEFAMDYVSKTQLRGAFIRKVDRMSMATSLEVRVPLLDRRIVEFALKLPIELKVRQSVGKYILRKAGRPYLPDEVYSHPKQGFLPPLFEWFNDEFWSLMRQTCARGGELSQLFKRTALERIISDGMHAYSNQQRVSYDAATARAWLMAQLGYWLRAFRVSM